MQIDLRDAVFGTEKEISVDTAVGCPTCHGDGAQPGTGTRTCDVCGGRGQVQHVQRSFMGNVMTSRPCTTCQGFGTVIANPCIQCSGEGRVRSRRSLTIRIPAGVDTGTRIQLAGEGEVGAGNGPAGDLYVEIVVANHSTFVRRGDDLHATVGLPMTAAALGTSITLETLDGEQTLDIEPGTQSGQVTTLRGFGVTHLRGRRTRRPGRARRGQHAEEPRRRAARPAVPAGRPARGGAPRGRGSPPTAAGCSAACGTPSAASDT